MHREKQLGAILMRTGRQPSPPPRSRTLNWTVNQPKALVNLAHTIHRRNTGDRAPLPTFSVLGDQKRSRKSRSVNCHFMRLQDILRTDYTRYHRLAGKEENTLMPLRSVRLGSAMDEATVERAEAE